MYFISKLSAAMFMEMFSDILLGFISLWIAAFAGLLIGWSWRPRWAATLVMLVANSRSRFVWTLPPGFGVRRIWFAFTALSAFSLLNRLIRRSRASSCKFDGDQKSSRGIHSSSESGCSAYSDSEDEQPELTEADLGTLMSYIEQTDGGPSWKLIMERSTPNLSYQAWFRDPPLGPTQYRTRTIIENVAPDLVSAFFWDDEFRPKWDNMLIYFRTLKECQRTGTMIVHWIRKFPFFCSDREYIIIRRIWESGSIYYCVTKGTHYPALPRHRSPRRVDLYYSSWCIKAESRSGQLTASEVLLFHHEEMGIPKELAKIGIRMGMWGVVKKMDINLQAYWKERLNRVPPSPYAIMANITAKNPLTVPLLPQLEADEVEQRLEHVENHQEPKNERKVLKWLVVGGILIACGLCGGSIGKGILFGMVKGVQRISEKNGKQEVAGNKNSEK